MMPVNENVADADAEYNPDSEAIVSVVEEGSTCSNVGSNDNAGISNTDPDSMQKRWAVLATLREQATYMGPGFLISVAYMDPGNWATNIAAGAKYESKLLWVIVLASVMAMCIQVVCAKLGIATGKNIATLCRERLRPILVYILWAAAEIAMIATDMAEIIGAALGFQLIFNLPLWVGAILAAVFSFALIGIRSYFSKGFRIIEFVVMTFVAVIALIFVVELFFSKPSAAFIFSGLKPTVPDTEALFIGIGMLGATVMPHSVYLHADIVQDRRDRLLSRHGGSEETHRRHLRFESADTVLALTGALFVNGAMLILAAVALYGTGSETVTEAFDTLQLLYGPGASILFGLALIASGLSSSLIATMAGQCVMDGFLNWRVNVWIRRSVTLVPSLAIVLAGLEPTKVLVASQVALSFELPFVLIPLVYFSASQSLMGSFVNSKVTTAILCIMVGFIVALNVWLLVSLAMG